MREAPFFFAAWTRTKFCYRMIWEKEFGKNCFDPSANHRYRRWWERISFGWPWAEDLASRHCESEVDFFLRVSNNDFFVWLQHFSTYTELLREASVVERAADSDWLARLANCNTTAQWNAPSILTPPPIAINPDLDQINYLMNQISFYFVN